VWRARFGGRWPSGRGAVNDLLVDFGSHGLWVRLNNDRWVRLDAANPLAVAACPENSPGLGDTIYASFAERGLQRRFADNPHFFDFRSEVPIRLVTGDTDGNGYCDIVEQIPLPRISDDFPGPSKLMAILNQNDAIRFGTSRQAGLYALGNFDATPNDDIAALTDRGLLVGLNNLGAGSILSFGGANNVAAGDIDGDGFDEIVVEKFGELGAFYDPLAGLDARGDEQPTPLGHSARGALAVGDLDADPRDDIVFSDTGSTWALYDNTPPFVKLSSNRAFILAIADLDNDGRNDVVADFGSRGVFVKFANRTAFTLLRAWRSEALVPCACD